MDESTPALDALAAAGVPVDSIEPEKRAVLASLSEDETTVLVGIIEKLDAEVEGFGFQMGGMMPQLKPSLDPMIVGRAKPLTPSTELFDPSTVIDRGGLFW